MLSSQKDISTTKDMGQSASEIVTLTSISRGDKISLSKQVTLKSSAVTFLK